MKGCIVATFCLIMSGMLIAPPIASAECSRGEGQILLTCQDDAVNTCRAAHPTCREPARTVTVEDVLSSVGGRCCALHGARASSRQRACFLLAERRFASARVVTDSSIKRFLGKAKSAVGALRRAGCSSGSL